MRGLIFLMLGAGMIKICQLVKCKLAIAFGIAEQMCFVAAISGKYRQFLHALISGSRRIAVADPAPPSELLQAGVQHSAPESVLEALMKVTNLPQLVFDPA